MYFFTTILLKIYLQFFTASNFTFSSISCNKYILTKSVVFFGYSLDYQGTLGRPSQKQQRENNSCNAFIKVPGKCDSLYVIKANFTFEDPIPEHMLKFGLDACFGQQRSNRVTTTRRCRYSYHQSQQNRMARRIKVGLV